MVFLSKGCKSFHLILLRLTWLLGLSLDSMTLRPPKRPFAPVFSTDFGRQNDPGQVGPQELHVGLSPQPPRSSKSKRLFRYNTCPVQARPLLVLLQHSSSSITSRRIPTILQFSSFSSLFVFLLCGGFLSYLLKGLSASGIEQR